MNKWYIKIRDLLELMEQKSASDLHITVGVQPYLRVDGDMIPTGIPPLTEEECELMLFSLLSEAQIAQFKEKKVLDFSYGEKELGRFRINIYRQRGTTAAAIRRLPNKIPNLEDLGLPVQTVQNLCDRTSGLVIVAGPVGCGKTTTLASMAQYINRTRFSHIISVEDPIEYLHESNKSLIHQRELHTDTLTYADALKYGLREDPDVMMIGEMRDLETISSAVTIAETGHLVLATLHTANAGEAISRIVDVFPAAQQAQVRLQLSFTLTSVINQLLIPLNNTVGRVLSSEILLVTPAIQNLIRDNKLESIYSHIQLGVRFGMKTMSQSLYDLIKVDKINKEIAIAMSPRPKELEKMLLERL